MLLGEDEDNTRSLQRETSEISSLLKEFPRNTNILVVDHNFTDLLDMKKTMRQYAYQVTVEADAEKAFAFLTSCQHEINIVIWDFHMPGINGIQALKDIGSKMDIPVVIMSDDNQTESVMEATIHGACDYVMKPVREEIIANIWQHIVRKRMMSEKMKMMSQPDSSPPVQSDLAQSDGLDKDKADSKILDQEPNIDRKEENEAMTTPTTWTDESQLVLVQTNNVDQQSDGSITKYQGIGKEENAAKIPLLTWSEGTQLVQSADQLVQSADQLVQSADQLVQTDGLDQYNGGFQFIDQDDDEPSIEKRYGSKQRRQRMMWSRELHQKFLDAIELAGGIRRSSPKKIHQILKGMNIEGLTRYNVASHLQKHRLTITESEIRQKRTAYRTTRLSRGSNNVTLRNDSNNVTLGNGSNNVQTAISSSYLMTGQAVNPIQQTQYQNGSLTMNNNQFITNQLPPLPYVDPRLYQHKHQQQQQLYQQQPYQQQQQPYQPQQQPYQQQQQQYQPQQQPYQPQQQQYQPQQQPYQHQQQQYQPQQQQYQSSHQFNYVVSNEQPEQASGIGVTGLELTYPSVPPYDPFEHLMKGYSFNQ